MVYAKYWSAKVTIDFMNQASEKLMGALDIELSHICDMIQDEAQEAARKRTGRMAAMTTKKKLKQGNAVGYEVSGTAPYTIYQHEGTRYIDAHPYIKEAFDNHIDDVKNINIMKLMKGKTFSF